MLRPAPESHGRMGGAKRVDPPCAGERSAEFDPAHETVQPREAATHDDKGGSVLEKIMAAHGRMLSTRWFVVVPLVVAVLVALNAGWSQVEMSALPFERLWSPREGRLSREWDYYEVR